MSSIKDMILTTTVSGLGEALGKTPGDHNAGVYLTSPDSTGPDIRIIRGVTLSPDEGIVIDVLENPELEQPHLTVKQLDEMLEHIVKESEIDLPVICKYHDETYSMSGIMTALDIVLIVATLNSES